MIDAPTISPPTVLYRVARKATPLDLPPRYLMGNNRFDDPERCFGTTYAAEHPLTCMVEVMARFRTSLSALRGLASIHPRDVRLSGYATIGRVDRQWLDNRVVVAFAVDQVHPFLDLDHPQTLQLLRGELAALADDLGIHDIDLSSVSGPHRQFTKAIARWAYEHGYGGLVYTSRFGILPSCWAVFDMVEVRTIESPRPITDYPGLLREAGGILGVGVDIGCD
jgi:hypothetical protein